jgi:hypothetical protein
MLSHWTEIRISTLGQYEEELRGEILSWMDMGFRKQGKLG